MPVIAFNSLRYANQLKSAGVPSIQAEAQAEALAEVFEIHLAELASKADMKALEDRLDARMKALEDRLDSRMREVEDRLDARMRALEDRLTASMEKIGLSIIVKTGGMLLVAVGALAAIIKLLP